MKGDQRTIFDVAKYILTKLGPMTTMKLQKLCYYSICKNRRDFYG